MPILDRHLLREVAPCFCSSVLDGALKRPTLNDWTKVQSRIRMVYPWRKSLMSRAARKSRRKLRLMKLFCGEEKGFATFRPRRGGSHSPRTRKENHQLGGLSSKPATRKPSKRNICQCRSSPRHAARWRETPSLQDPLSRGYREGGRN